MGSVNDSLIVNYGRFQPPTIGHAETFLCIRKLKDELNFPECTFISPKVDEKKNPLTFEQRYNYLSNLFPDNKFNYGNIFKSPWDILKFYSDCGIRNMILVAGSDRVEKYRSEFPKYIGHKDPDKCLKFDYFEVYNTGERNNVSGTIVRSLVKQNDFEEFKKYIPTDDENLVKSLFSDLRQGMKCQ